MLPGGLFSSAQRIQAVASCKVFPRILDSFQQRFPLIQLDAIGFRVDDEGWESSGQRQTRCMIGRNLAPMSGFVRF
jgi:hypothetical protein